MTPVNSIVNTQNWIDLINDSDDYIKDMMAFYKNGWVDRGEDDIKKIQDKVRANITLTFMYVDKVLNKLTKMGFTENCVYLKIDSLIAQTVLITIPIEKYLCDDFTKIYSFTTKIQKSSKSENYSVRFNFTFDNGNIDEEILKGDGFHKMHSKLKEKY